MNDTSALNEPVRADHDVDAAPGEPFENALLFAGSAETADALDDEGILGQAFAEGAEMLLGEDGGRHQHGYLLAVVDRS